MLQRKTRPARVFLWLALCWPLSLAAAEQPYIEVGGALINQYLADYRGSSRYQLKVLPAPYALYVGRWLKADRGGLRSDLIANNRVEVGVSLSASLGGDSDGNPIREGMPELGIPFELGPTVNINLTGVDFREGWALRLPLRGVAAWEGGVNGVGFLFAPHLAYRMSDVGHGWRFSSNVGLLFADGRYHDYFYGVEPRYATAERPAYNAEGGYSGAFAEFYVYRRFGDTRLAFGIRGDALNGATFADSPLMETEHSFSVSVVLVRTFWRNRPRGEEPN